MERCVKHYVEERVVDRFYISIEKEIDYYEPYYIDKSKNKDDFDLSM